MKPIDIDKIKGRVDSFSNEAERILSGEGDGYDGADGARNVAQLCSIAEDLITHAEAAQKNYDRLLKAIVKECSQFNFPDEDRPILFDALTDEEKKKLK